MTIAAAHILPLASEQATLPVVGGKGASLVELARAGFPVPAGFVVTTGAYHAFVVAHGLQPHVLAALPAGPATDPDLLEEASAAIRALFAAHELPPALAAELLAAYAQLGRPAVAVRSSATAEDRPDMSFAGQQDTYLNVGGDGALLRAVVRCWSSLWTARAISYRAHNGVPHTDVALAVVVQVMVQSQASGVLFTANPLTGLRTETVIDATLGLGEALVSGQVEPDHYVVDTASGRIVAKTLGSKAISVRSRAGGGTEAVPNAPGAGQALPDEGIRALAQLGRQVGVHYGSPQDVEWAWAEGTLYLLQSRPITSLYPLPEGLPPEPLQVMFSLAAVQGLLDPITPLGRDMIPQVLATGMRLFSIQTGRSRRTVLYSAGERLWANITPLLHSSIGRRVVRSALALAEPTTGQVLAAIWDDARLESAPAGLRLRMVGHLARFFLPVVGNALLNVLAPHARRKTLVSRCERLLEIASERCQAMAGHRRVRLAQWTSLIVELCASDYLTSTLIRLFSAVASGVAALHLLNALSKGLPDDSADKPRGRWSDLVLRITRGMPHNPTTAMDLELWQVARAVRGDAASREACQGHTPAQLAARYQAGGLPSVAQQALAQFLDRYGARGLGEIDMGRSRWAEEPAHILAVVATYLQIERDDQAPDIVFARAAVAASAAIDELVAGLYKGRCGSLRARLARLAAGRARALLGAREAPKFFIVRLLAIFRWALLDLGREFVVAGELGRPDDLFYLTLPELEALAAGAAADWPGAVGRRRECYRREQMRRQVPRLLLSDGRAFYGGTDGPVDAVGQMAGSPVSPGSAEGRVRVVLDPRQAGLRPGEILVCPGTDPSWTPLFLVASGLVMEVGGLMTHGAVVAREYGIPAIVGVDRATQRLRTGQRVRVNGSDGRITLLEE